MRKNRLFVLLALSLAVCMLLTGCVAARTIREDSVKEDLPSVEPDAGIRRDVNAMLYFRLSGERYLASVYAEVPVHINETPEAAIVRALINANHIAAEDDLSLAFPDGTEIKEVTKDNNILYVTLSSAYLDDGPLQQAEQEKREQLEQNLITKAEYDAQMEALREEIYTQRRMGLYAIVNSVTAYDPTLRVLLSAERQEGDSERIHYDELGIETETELSSSLIEPLSFEESVIATPESMLECVLRHLVLGETEKAYFWIAEGRNTRPTLSEFEAALENAERITQYEMTGFSLGSNVNYAYAEADITVVRASDGKETTRHKRIRMQKEGELYKADHESLLQAVGGKLE